MPTHTYTRTYLYLPPVTLPKNKSQRLLTSHPQIALDEAKHEQNDNSTQLDKALAELCDVQAENKRLNSENKSQQRAISHLKIALDEAKHEQDNNSTQLEMALNELLDENKRLQRSISHLKTALDKAKHEQARSLIKVSNQLCLCYFVDSLE